MNRGPCSSKIALASFLLPFLAVAANALWSTAARAAYDRPFAWSDIGEIDLKPVFRSYYASEDNLLDPQIPESAYELALSDADHRISDEFAIPAQLQSSVEFWLRIYTRYTTHEVVVFDDRHPEVVYEVLDFRPLRKSARNDVAFEITMERKIGKIREQYRSAFLSLRKNPHKKKLNEFESKIRQALAVCKHRHPLAFHAENLHLQAGQRDNIIKGLLAAEAFFPKMESIFDGLGIPPEVTRLSLVESSFNVHAVSYAGATGVWQFMLKSGQEYLKIDHKLNVDERLSPLKSTVAAARLLKRNRKVLRNWPFAITAYNHGLKTFHRSPRAREARTHADAGRLFAPCPKDRGLRLGWASRNYYAEFLAVLYAEKYRNIFYGEPPVSLAQSIRFHGLPKSQSALDFAMGEGIALQAFRFLNPDIRDLNRKLPSGFLVAVPGERDDFAHLTRYVAGREAENWVAAKRRKRPLDG